MALYEIPQRIKHRRGTYTELYQRNEILLEGEECFETHDADGIENAPWKCKVGDGSTAWNDLEYESVGDGGGAGGVGQCPYFISDGDSFTVETNKQVLFSDPIELDGDAVLVIDGRLIEVS